MKTHTLLAGAAIAALLSGCYTYPVYQPVPVARLTPEQSAALANGQTLSQADRDRLARDNAQVAQQDSYTYAAPVAPAYYPAPYYVSPYYYGYPYYGGYYGGFYPSISLGFGFGGRFGGHYGGWHGGGGFRGHR